jgi:hypothetical protein
MREGLPGCGLAAFNEDPESNPFPVGRDRVLVEGEMRGEKGRMEAVVPFADDVMEGLPHPKVAGFQSEIIEDQVLGGDIPFQKILSSLFASLPEGLLDLEEQLRDVGKENLLSLRENLACQGHGQMGLPRTRSPVEVEAVIGSFQILPALRRLQGGAFLHFPV